MPFEAGRAVFIKNLKIYEFKENEQGFDGKSCTLTHSSSHLQNTWQTKRY